MGNYMGSRNSTGGGGGQGGRGRASVEQRSHNRPLSLKQVMDNQIYYMCAVYLENNVRWDMSDRFPRLTNSLWRLIWKPFIGPLATMVFFTLLINYRPRGAWVLHLLLITSEVRNGVRVFEGVWFERVSRYLAVAIRKAAVWARENPALLEDWNEQGRGIKKKATLGDFQRDLKLIEKFCDDLEK